MHAEDKYMEVEILEEEAEESLFLCYHHIATLSETVRTSVIISL